jgi:hypothetical protein
MQDQLCEVVDSPPGRLKEFFIEEFDEETPTEESKAIEDVIWYAHEYFGFHFIVVS